MLMVCSSRLYILAMDGLSKLTANELKSQRARERYTALSVEEKGALVQRNPENRERKNSASTSGTDVAAIVSDVGPIDHYANFPNSVRKVALMDSKGEKLPVQRTSPA
ncbi:Os06g0626466 [Oryza sativa Japonica Group]|uniref:Os06g0626466 protein n=1 Tax=Oryza sativa subsp. japonica TaxID=39947 RepID=C7J3Z2_ORYSJ|nr:Os06g0626466 [Oryza sativa Japonica Group]|eukprot:NP_001174911.1 Os06g0626466 [Oryza sativa Japonica Group]